MTSTHSALPVRKMLLRALGLVLAASLAAAPQALASPDNEVKLKSGGESKADSGASTNADLPVQASPSEGGKLVGKVLLKRRRRTLADRSNIVVYLENVPGDAPTPSATAHEIRQHNKQFTPKVSAVVIGTTVAFPNDDRIFHNVFSMSRAMKFDLGLYKSGTSKSVVATHEGIVDIYCNIHPGMAAKVLVLPNAFFSITDKEGNFAIDGVPPGNYPVVAWQTGGDPYRGEVTISADGITSLDIEMKVGRSPVEAHTRKDGTPYGRYR